MAPIQVISLDMFQTLVNVDSRNEQVWKPILGPHYTYHLAEQYSSDLLEHFFVKWVEAKQSGVFCLMSEVYEQSFLELFSRIPLSYDAKEAVRILFQEHALAHFYEETVGFLERISQSYKVCIISDADDAMISGFYEQYGVKLFTSEQHRSYKNDGSNTMFKELLRHYGVGPDQVVHIGDSVSDVFGASREGIRSCWLNRNNRTWQHEVKPDYVITRLDELEELLSGSEEEQGS